QIKDDILDYTSTNIIGKPAWNDLKEQKITLPLLHALSQVPKSEQRRIKHLLKKHKNKHGKLKEIVDFVTAFGGIEYAQQTIDTMCKEAIELTSVFPQNESRDTMVELIQFVSTRIK
ncbi:MAG TPA: polyprenyl synthetase family protein, partial [Bacteroidales bacterium]|nr:polyprenyl synthetase family protein [Bacteroidales bacterium]